MPHDFAFRMLIPKRKAFADIYRNDVRSFVRTYGNDSIENNLVITWYVGRLANLSPSGASRHHVTCFSCVVNVTVNFPPISIYGVLH